MSKDLHTELLLKIDSKLDRVDERLDNLTIIQSSQQKDLEYHIKRTDLLEEKVESFKPSRILIWAGGASVAIMSLYELWQTITQ